MFNMRALILSLSLTTSLLAGCVSKEIPTEVPKATRFAAYIEQLKVQAKQEGIDKEIIEAAFAKVHFINRVVYADRNQPERKFTLDDYLRIVLPESKIELGKALMKQNAGNLRAMRMVYQVPENYIAALWGIESHFGEIQGKEDVISALATLAFEGRREVFFRSELMAALHILDQGHIAIEDFKGSWAGAMGQCQFMPSSYLTYGADGNGDGRIDIWNTQLDVFASIANYLHTEHWRPGIKWGREVILPASMGIEVAGLTDAHQKTVNQWAKLGIKNLDGKPLPHSTLPAWILLPDGIEGRAFLVYSNVKTLMHWNRSSYFAISVGMLADRLAENK